MLFRSVDSESVGLVRIPNRKGSGCVSSPLRSLDVSLRLFVPGDLVPVKDFPPQHRADQRDQVSPPTQLKVSLTLLTLPQHVHTHMHAPPFPTGSACEAPGSQRRYSLRFKRQLVLRVGPKSSSPCLFHTIHTKVTSQVGVSTQMYCALTRLVMSL